MKKMMALFFIAFLLPALLAVHNHPSLKNLADADSSKPRVFVLTDISNEPDDEESMVRFLVYANEFNVEGIVATTSTWLRKNTREDLILRQLSSYEKVLPNLSKHAVGYPTYNDLRKVVATGQPEYGMAAVGKGKTTEGSKLLLKAADASSLPLWVCVWGGANTLAQALFDARELRNTAEMKTLISKLRVYAISDQDDAGYWLRKEFPDLLYIVSPSSTDSKEYYRATWTGISGDRWYKNGPKYKFEMVDNPWLETNIRINHGPLGELYPKLEYIMEGDTPSFLGLINNGLGWIETPSNGGWGGRYKLYKYYGESRPIWTNTIDTRDCITMENGTTECSDQATIWRWRADFQFDFAARMDWCIQSNYKNANHNPVAVINGDSSKNVIVQKVKAGQAFSLNAGESKDPDGNKLNFTWFVYAEAGSGKGELSLTEGANTMFIAMPSKQEQNIHVVLKAEDNGNPKLVSYRRIVFSVPATEN
jgi:Protein of unknown function (DUF1593)